MEMLESVPVASPLSLLDLCTQMVATHLDMVESFLGLPSLIGERIFTVGSETDKFRSDVEYSTQAVTLFTEAYGEEFLSSLNVCGEHLGLNYCLEQILLFTDLKRLNLSNCGIGDDHEMLEQFQHLYRLEVLLLEGNAVSNVGVQKMTVPYRMFHRGPACLQMLDLRDNSVSRQCLRYLVKFESLHTVMFSEAIETKKGMSALTHGSEQFGCWTLCKDEVTDADIHTEGWAKVLIDRWMMEARLKSVKSKPIPKTGLFSIKKCPIMETSNLSAITNSARNQPRQHIVAKRVDITGVKTDLGEGDSAETLKKITEDDEKELIKELYGIYKADKIPGHNEDTFLQRLDVSEKESINRASESDSERFKNKSTRVPGSVFLNLAKGKKQRSGKDIVKKRSKVVDDVFKSRKRSISDFMIKKSVTENSDLKRNEISTGRLCAGSLSVACQNVDEVKKTDNQSIQMKSSQPDMYDHQSNDKSLPPTRLSSVSEKINCLPTSKTDCVETLNTNSLNRKSRKRKRIIIKKNQDANAVLSGVTGPGESACYSDNDSSVNNEQKNSDKENMPNSKRLKPTFLQYLDKYSHE